ncbi:MAG: DUF4160 domain-containing protein, partial [Endozoicomonadaceae bacterium]|nr:DUF4160 domain-containing protein [Endozoicomonadaceae bacterium]
PRAGNHLQEFSGRQLSCKSDHIDFFYSNEHGEPAHIHIQRDGALIKFWLKPVALASSTRFSAKEIRELQKHVETHQNKFLEAWNEYFKG